MRQTSKPSSRGYELTSTQLSMWTGQKFNPDSPMYNMPIVFEFLTKIEEDKFKDCFLQLVKDCEAMRAVFIEEKGHPYQFFLADYKYDFQIHDLSDHLEKEKILIDKIDRSIQQVFDLSTPSFESFLVKMSDERYVWLLNQHHIITDASSSTLQYNSMMSLYLGERNLNSETKNAIVKYSSFLDSLSKLHESKRWLKSQEYWTNIGQSLGAPRSIFNRQNIENTSRSSRTTFDIGIAKSNKLRSFQEDNSFKTWSEDLTLYNIFNTLLFVLLRKITSYHDLCIGSPAHNRINDDRKNTAGTLIELFPVQVKIENNYSFKDVYDQVSEKSLQFLMNTDTGLSTSNLQRSFNVVLNYINTSFKKFDRLPMKSKWAHTGHADPGHHLRLQVYDFDGTGNITVGFDTNDAIFSPEDRQSLLVSFEQLIDDFISDPYATIDEKKIPSNDKVDKQVEDDAFTSIIELYDKAFPQDALGQIIIKDQDLHLSFDDFERQSNLLSNYLLQNNIRKGDRVALYLDRSAAFINCVFACTKIGAVFIPIPIDYPEGRVHAILEDAQPKAVLGLSHLNKDLAEGYETINLDEESSFIENSTDSRPSTEISGVDPIYIMYTSGSTGKPKGVVVNHAALANYVQFAKKQYVQDFRPIMPFFSSIGFDLTITSLFLPFIANGQVHIYRSSEKGPDLSIIDVIRENQCNIVKLTPSHLELLANIYNSESKIEVMIVGGENFSSDLAHKFQIRGKEDLRIYNEYGPTEATVGCIVRKFQPNTDNNHKSVPIGNAIPNCKIYLLDEFLDEVPTKVAGEIYISGSCLASEYWRKAELTKEKFIAHPISGIRMYKSGDLALRDEDGLFHYLGRIDEQVKIGGRRVELQEIVSAINEYEGISFAHVTSSHLLAKEKSKVTHCRSCGLPSNYPDANFNEEDICQLCQNYEDYQEKVKGYFQNLQEFKNIINAVPKDQKGKYDCLVLLSGGKDSTYTLAKVKELGFIPLAFTLDNGYISEEAKDNVRKVVKALEVDHVFGSTEAMNEIFVDSLKRHCNVCDGCFKTIYTLSTKLALDNQIPFIITGLSRGQFFETRLTEELFRSVDSDFSKIDEVILNARKEYHQVDDAVKRLLDTSMFDNDEVFEAVQFVDFFRYTDVSLDEMLDFLDTKVPWVRPSDTGRSTNCIINKAGIYVHRKKKGYSNYAFPYSWDVRVGHKEREASIEEVNEEVNEEEVMTILDEIGYDLESDDQREVLIAYYKGSINIDRSNLMEHLATKLPAYMIPKSFTRLGSIPLTNNGKLDKSRLPEPLLERRMSMDTYIGPQNEIQEIIHEIWISVLRMDKIGIHDHFLQIGGDSLSAIKIISRINEQLELDLPVTLVFQQSTIEQISVHIKETILQLMQELEN